jgi:hypothetical protein
MALSHSNLKLGFTIRVFYSGKLYTNLCTERNRCRSGTYPFDAHRGEKKKKEAKRATDEPRKDSATKIQRSLVGSYDDVGVSLQLRREC